MSKPGDAGDAVRAMRDHDIEQERLRAEDEAAEPQTRSSEEVHADLRRALGLPETDAAPEQ